MCFVGFRSWESINECNRSISRLSIAVGVHHLVYKGFQSCGYLYVNRTKDWIEKTAAHVDKLLGATFLHICTHPAKKVRQGLLGAIQGLLSYCSYTLKRSGLMLLVTLCVLVVNDFEEVSIAAQEFLEYSFASKKDQLEHDVAEIFCRLIDKLLKVVFGSEESLAITQA